MDRVNGVHVPELAKKITVHAQIPVLPSAATILAQSPPKEVGVTLFSCGCIMLPWKQDLDVRLKRLTHSAPCMLFMKGTPTEPRCGERGRKHEKRDMRKGEGRSMRKEDGA